MHLHDDQTLKECEIPTDSQLVLLDNEVRYLRQTYRQTDRHTNRQWRRWLLLYTASKWISPGDDMRRYRRGKGLGVVRALYC